MRIGDFRVGGDTLANASRWLATYSEFSSVAILVRSGNIQQFTKEKFMTRAQMANMPSSLAQSLNTWCVEALRRELSILREETTFGSFDEPLVEVLIEVLSRLTFKLRPEDLHKAILVALDFHAQPLVAGHIRLCKSCQPWFRRLFEAANDQQLIEWLPDLIRFPLRAGNNESGTLRLDRWPDPLVDNDMFARRIGVAKNWYSMRPPALLDANEWLLEQAQTESANARQRALARLIEVYRTGAMNEEQERRLGIRLWEKTSASGLPDLPDVPCLNFLHLPKPEDIDVISKVRQFVKALTPSDQVRPDGSIAIGGSSVQDRAIFEIALVSKPIVQIPHEPKGVGGVG